MGTAAGIADPAPAARALMALGDGLMLHRPTVDPGLDVRPVIECAVSSLMPCDPVPPGNTVSTSGTPQAEGISC